MGLLYVSAGVCFTFHFTHTACWFYHKPKRVHVADLQTFKYVFLLDNKRIVVLLM